MAENRSLIRFEANMTNVSYDLPVPHDRSQPKVITELVNAWNESAILDDAGRVWVSTDKLNSLLRTNKGNAEAILFGIQNKYRSTINNIEYIWGPEILKTLDSLYQNSLVLKTRENRKYSLEMYEAMRDSVDAKYLRAEYANFIHEITNSSLKQKRIKSLSLKYDELTGMIFRKTEFSHIRSVAHYPYLADQYWNGLVINKATHSIITQNSVNNEDDLLKLCELNQWDTRWYYNHYRHELQNTEGSNLKLF